MFLNMRGKIVKKCLLEIPDHFNNVILNIWVIMPDHVHILLQIHNKRNPVVETQQCCVSTTTDNKTTNDSSKTFYKLKPGSIPAIIRSFKSICTRKIHEMEKNKHFGWQRSFYDRVIWDEQILQNVESYIRNNPKKYHLKQKPR